MFSTSPAQISRADILPLTIRRDYRRLYLGEND